MATSLELPIRVLLVLSGGYFFDRQTCIIQGNIQEAFAVPVRPVVVSQSLKQDSGAGIPELSPPDARNSKMVTSLERPVGRLLLVLSAGDFFDCQTCTSRRNTQEAFALPARPVAVPRAPHKSQARACVKLFQHLMHA